MSDTKFAWLNNPLDSLKRHVMYAERVKEQRVLELALIVVVMGIMCLLYTMPDYWTLILNLYFLPVAFSGFFLGRYRAGVTAGLCVLSAAFTTFNLTDPTRSEPVLVNILTLCVWGGVLGLTALLIGTLSDERNRKFRELHQSHKTDSLSDALTGIANRRAFELELSRRMSGWMRCKEQFSLILIDVDHFKKFNDTYGHPAGDAVLRGVASKLNDSVRGTDLVARYGGEEFGIIMRHDSTDEAREIAERARVEIESSRYLFEGLKLRVTVSVGVAHTIKNDDSAAIVERADAALYTSKQSGRNCAHFHNGNECEHFGASIPCTTIDSHCDKNEKVDAADAYTDNITGLPSRKVFVEELRRRISEAHRYNNALSVMLVQLDQLDEITDNNETIREKILSVIGELTRNVMREADLVARYGRSQFAVLMPSTIADGAMIPADRLRMSVAECDYVTINGASVAFTVSVGLANLQTGDDAAAIWDRAQSAIEQASGLGGNRTYICRDEDSFELIEI